MSLGAQSGRSQVTPEEYLDQRVNDQIQWYDDKSRGAQKWFKRIRRTEIACAAAIPFLAGFASHDPAVPIATGLLGGVVVVLAAFLSLSQHQENWIEYRTICESLKHEKFLFLTKTEPYDSENRFALFVQRVESLISKENSGWSQYTRAGAKTSKPTDRQG